MDGISIVKKAVEKYGNNQNKLLPIFQYIIKENDCISETDFKEIANEINLPVSEVYGTASFYSFLNTKPYGKYVIRICKTITCSMKGKDEIINTIENFLNVKLGKTSKDNKFTLLETNCIGQCDSGPAMLINEKVYSKLTPEKAIEIIEKLN